MQPLYAGLVFSQIFTLVAYVLVTIGAALLQNKADTDVHDLMTAGGWSTSPTKQVYTEVFTGANIMPYTQSKMLKFQFQYQWWIIEFELLIFVLTALLTLMPKHIARGKAVALPLLASALPLVMDNMNSLNFLVRNDVAKSIFIEERLKTTFAGLILVFIGNMLTIIFMGLYEMPAASEQQPKSTVILTAGEPEKVAERA